MKKTPFKQHLSYWFDNMMSKGTAALVLLLFAMTLIVVCVVALLVSLFAPSVTGSMGNSLWQSLMRVLDAGNIAGDIETNNAFFIFLMVITTVCGLFVTSILIGIINSAFESKLARLRKGNSHVIENGHVLILGFDAHIFMILSELIAANENEKRPAIVVLANRDKEEMDSEIAARIPDFKNTRIITRSGDMTSFSDLENVSIESCASVIVLSESDFLSVKAILSATTLLEKLQVPQSTYVTAVINNAGSLEAARIAGGRRTEVLYFEKTISRIFAQTCRQSGLSHIYSELFDFGGDEIYMEKAPSLAGKAFALAPLFYEKASVMGLRRNGRILLNPSADTVLEGNDEIILIAADDGMAKPLLEPGAYDEHVERSFTPKPPQKESMVILGYSKLTADIIKEVALYAEKGSSITVATPSAAARETLAAQALDGVTLSVVEDNIYDRPVLEKLLSGKLDYIIVLNDEANAQSDDPDAYTLMLLLQLRDILKERRGEITIVSEMENSENQRLASCTGINDFVVGSNLVSLMMTQVSKNRSLNALFDELLTDEGCELYLKPVSDFVKPGVPANFFTVVHSACKSHCLALGYQRQTNDGGQIFLNPAKSESIIFNPNDKIIVIAQD
ncbi:MAG: hypothetical protein RR065_03410 [Clostridia bacterium]